MILLYCLKKNLIFAPKLPEKVNTASPYRQHNPGNDYYAPGIYLITLVVRDREPLLGCLNMDIRYPGVNMTGVGIAVDDCWQQIPAHHAAKGRSVSVLASSVMPDHFHGVIEVRAPLDVSVGEVIRSFKTACTRAWRASDPHFVSPNLAIQSRLQRLSAKQRQAFYASEEGRPYRPLFDDNYDDTICLAERHADGSIAYDERHLAAMIHYVHDNPRRAIIRRLHPDFMQRCLCLNIGGHLYCAFGNLFLLKWADKRQVFFHRKAQKGQCDVCGRYYPFTTPYEETIQYQTESLSLLTAAREGRTVLVTPGISKGEQMIKNTAITEPLPLIHLQKEAISRYWKPERSRFEACEAGSLLILAPYDRGAEISRKDKDKEPESDYTRFHNLNDRAAEICDFLDEARVVMNDG